MRRLVVTTFPTLDGVMQSPRATEEGPSDGFTHGGWLVPHADQEMGRQMVEWFSGAEDFLLGTARSSSTANSLRRWPTSNRAMAGELQVHGSAGLIQTLLKHDLVEELRLMIFPVVLGEGKRLFADGTRFTY